MARCSTVAAIKRNAAVQDEGAFGILVLTIAAAVASLGALFAELAALLDRGNPLLRALRRAHRHDGRLVWTFTHTIFALHYAHDFYGGDEHAHGLKFPATPSPTSGTSSTSRS